MRMCMRHWNMLRAAIEARGLSTLVAESGEAAVKNLASELDHGSTIDNFDPLMGAHNAIVGNVMGLVGIAVMHPNEDGSERCPLCFISAEHKAHCQDPTCTVENYDNWIDRAADDMVTAWKTMKP